MIQLITQSLLIPFLLILEFCERDVICFRGGCGRQPLMKVHYSYPAVAGGYLAI